MSDLAKRLRELLDMWREVGGVYGAVDLTDDELTAILAALDDAELYREVRSDPSMLLHLSNRDFDDAIRKRIEARRAGR